MNKYQQKHIITLSNREELQLQGITRKGKHNVREIKRAHVPLKSSAGMKDKDIADNVGTTLRTVEPSTVAPIALPTSGFNAEEAATIVTASPIVLPEPFNTRGIFLPSGPLLRDLSMSLQYGYQASGMRGLIRIRGTPRGLDIGKTRVLLKKATL